MHELEWDSLWRGRGVALEISTVSEGNPCSSKGHSAQRAPSIKKSFIESQLGLWQPSARGLEPPQTP